MQVVENFAAHYSWRFWFAAQPSQREPLRRPQRIITGICPIGTWDDSTADWNSPLTGTLPLIGWSDDSPTDDSTAIFSGATAGTVTLGATVNPGTIDFNTSGYILAAPSPNPSNYQINIAGTAPAINVGTGNAAFTDTINANVEATSSSAPLLLTDTASRRRGGQHAVEFRRFADR